MSEDLRITAGQEAAVRTEALREGRMAAAEVRFRYQCPAIYITIENVLPCSLHLREI